MPYELFDRGYRAVLVSVPEGVPTLLCTTVQTLDGPVTAPDSFEEYWAADVPNRDYYAMPLRPAPPA